VVCTVLLLTASNVFVPFALLYMRQPVSWNFVWAGCCLMGAVYFMFK
jgi:uncharacterized protein (DUF486 family)